MISSGVSQSPPRDLRYRPQPTGAIVLLAIGASLLILYGVAALEANQALSHASRGSGLTFSCIGPCASTQGVAALAAGVTLLLTAGWMYRRPRFHVAEGLLACCVGAVVGWLVGGIGGGQLIPIALCVAGGVWAMLWSPTSPTLRVRLPR